MLKKIMLVVTVGLLLAAVAHLIAQEKGDPAEGRIDPVQGGALAAAPQPPTQRRGEGGREPGTRPGQDRPGLMRDMLGEWLNELTQAYEKKDREKMGKLLEDMKQRRQRFQRGTGRPGRGMPPEGMGRGGPSSIESSPIPKTEAEKKILSVLDDMDKNQRRGMMNVPITDGRLLRLLTEAVNARHVVEIGTSNGYSGIWFCLALRKTGGKLTTYEIDERRASLARENFKRVGVDKLVTLVEGDAHETVTKLKGPIDVVFIDADKEGYTDYLNKLLPLVRPGGLILAHNINMMRAGRGSGMQDYVKAVTTNPDLETVFYQQGGGISVTLKKR